MNADATHNTIAYLRLCQEARRRGYPVAYTSDPAWLVNMAINRRAGWPDDPSHSRGSAMPVEGHYPVKASGDYWRHLRQLADRINTARLVVRASELGEHRWLVTQLPDRFS